MGLFGPKTGHAPLFDEICQCHDIDKKTKTLLQAVIKKYQLPRPVEIFLLPELLHKAIADGDFSENTEELQKLCDTWF